MHNLTVLPKCEMRLRCAHLSTNVEGAPMNTDGMPSANVTVNLDGLLWVHVLGAQQFTETHYTLLF